MSISFELPLHGRCTSYRAILRSSQLIINFLDLKEVGLEEMPNAIILDGKRFLYAGVIDGMGQYQEETTE